MSVDKRVDGIYKILPLYEAVTAGESDLALQGYMAYLSRVYIQYVGIGDDEICELIRGLIHLRDNAEHDDVRRVVFHIISILKKDGE